VLDQSAGSEPSDGEEPAGELVVGAGELAGREGVTGVVGLELVCGAVFLAGLGAGGGDGGGGLEACRRTGGGAGGGFDATWRCAVERAGVDARAGVLARAVPERLVRALPERFARAREGFLAADLRADFFTAGFGVAVDAACSALG